MADDPASPCVGAGPPGTAGSLAVSPARRRRLFITSGLILGNELMERLAYYSLSTDLVTRLDMLGASSAEAASATMVWQGACYLVSIFGAWTADAWLGRYWTIVAFSSVYLLGLAGVVLSTGVAALSSRAWLMGALYIVALGTGGIKANVSSFGADQFDDASPAEAAAKSRYFNAFYFVINVGALIASLFVVNVQASVSWLVGYAIPAAAFAVAFAFFLAGTPLYVHVAPRGSPFVRLGAVFAAAAAKWRVAPPADPALLYESDSDDEDGGDACDACALEAKPAAGAPAPGLLHTGRGWSAGARPGAAPLGPPSRRVSATGDDDSADGGGLAWPRDAADAAALGVHHDPPLRLPSSVVRAAVRSDRRAATRTSTSAASEAGWAGVPRPLSAGVVSRAASSVAGSLSRAGSVAEGPAPATPGSGAIASASAAAAAATAAASGVRRRARAEAAAAAAAVKADNQLPTAFVPPTSRRLAHTTYARWLDKAATPLSFYYKSAAAAGDQHPPPPGGGPLCCCAALGPDDAVYEAPGAAAVAGKTVADLAGGGSAARPARLPGVPRPHAPRERHLCSVTQTEETKRMLSFLPICLSTVVFSAVYAQMSSTFVLQGRFMDRHVGGLTISSATLSAFNTIAVLICVPLYDMVVVPAVRRLRHGRAPTYLQRIGAGLALSVVTMAVAAGVEAWRLGIAARGGKPPSVFALVPQYALVGASEVCAFIGLMELCYSESPDSMRSLASALQLVTGAVGSFLSSAIVSAVESTARAYTGRGWLPDLDEGYDGRLDLFYTLLLVISAANLVFYLWTASQYRYKVLADPSVRAGRAGLAALAAAEQGRPRTADAEAGGWRRRASSAGTA